MSTADADKPQRAASTSAVFQMFQLATVVSAVDQLRYRMNHLEVILKGEKAGPYDLTEIPPPVTIAKAYEALKRVWKGISKKGPVVDELITGIAQHLLEGPPATSGVPRPGAAPAAARPAAAGTRTPRRAEEAVVSLEPEPHEKGAEEEDDEEEGDVFELEPQ